MTRIKLCGLSRECDIEAANELCVEYIGFVFAKKSIRYVTPERANELKKLLSRRIKAVGVFADESCENIARLFGEGIIDIAQLHGNEDENYIGRLRSLADVPVIKAFQIGKREDVRRAEASIADYILLDSGGGTGRAFDWNLIGSIKRPYFLAGGLGTQNVREAVETLHPFALDVSSGIETNGLKDKNKMAAFVLAARKEYEK